PPKPHFSPRPYTTLFRSTRARLTRWTTARIGQLQDFLQQIGKTPTGFVQFIPHYVSCPNVINTMIRGWFFDRFTGRKDSVFLLLDRKSTRLNSSHVSISY